MSHQSPVAAQTAQTAPLDERPELTRREEFTLRHRQSVVRLFEQRGDLRGVHPMADLVHDAVAWTA